MPCTYNTLWLLLRRMLKPTVIKASLRNSNSNTWITIFCCQITWNYSYTTQAFTWYNTGCFNSTAIHNSNKTRNLTTANRSRVSSAHTVTALNFQKGKFFMGHSFFGRKHLWHPSWRRLRRSAAASICDILWHCAAEAAATWQKRPRDQSRNRKLVRVTSSNECQEHKCFAISVTITYYLNQIWRRAQAPHVQHAGIAYTKFT